MCASWSQKPVLWKRGTSTSVRSLPLVPRVRAYAAAAATSAPCEISAPFEMPVLPEVKLMSAGAPGVISIGSRACGAARQIDLGPGSSLSMIRRREASASDPIASEHC